MRQIELTQGKVAIVSNEDYEYLSQWDWYANKGSSNWYAIRREYLGLFNGKEKYNTFRMHREIAKRMGLDLTNLIDHIDRNSLNNQRSNLRSVTNKQNCENQSLDKRNTSGYRGVSWDKNSHKWSAYIRHNYKLIYLGRYTSIEDAIDARKIAEMKYFTHAHDD